MRVDDIGTVGAPRALVRAFQPNTALDPTGGGSVWAGFMSKIGLATGPLIGAVVLGTDRFGLLTGVAAALLLAALIAAMTGAGEADRRRASARGNVN